MRFRFLMVATLGAFAAGAVALTAWSGGVAAPRSGSLLADNRPNAADRCALRPPSLVITSILAVLTLALFLSACGSGSNRKSGSAGNARPTVIVVPSSALETMNLGAIGGLSALRSMADARPPEVKTEPTEPPR